ncbi:MAG: YfcE family phosphodiesterase [Treponema sp.]|nr:YfcE family phosphodiesterase [Treponema sp.]
MLKQIVQESNNLIGSKEDIEALSSQDHARLLVISDSHGHRQVLEEIIKNYGKECHALVFCGDGAGDLAYILNLSKRDSLMQEALPGVIALARGNGDPSTYPVNPDFSLNLPNSQSFIVNGHKILVVHGHREGIDFGFENLGLEMQLSECKLAFYGHTHIAREDRINDYQLVNPGSCARPRGGQPAGFAIATVEKTFIDIAFIKMQKDLEGKKSYRTWQPIY